MNEEEEQVIHIEAFGAPNSKTYTVRIRRFFYRIPRISISIIEGYHTKEPNPHTGKTIEDASHENRVFSMTCRPRDMYDLAKTVIGLCEPNE